MRLRPSSTAMLAAFAATAFMLLSSCGKAQKPAKQEDTAKTPQPPKHKLESTPPVEDREEGSLKGKIRIPPPSSDERTGRLSVEVDSSNIVVDKRRDAFDSESTDAASSTTKKKGSVKETPTPPYSMASIIKARRLDIKWQPQWSFKGVGGVRLLDMQASPDSSVLIFLETTGSDNGPFGSRFIIWDAHSWTVAKIIEVKQRFITSFRFIPGTRTIACACERQAELKQPYGLAVLDLDDGSIRQFFSTAMKSIAHILPAKDSFIYASFNESKGFVAFNTSGADAELQHFKSQNKSPALALSPDMATLACAGEKSLEIFKLPNVRPLSSIALPEGFTAGSIAFSGNSSDGIVLTPRKDSQANLFILRGKIFRKLIDSSSGISAIGDDGRSLFVAETLKGVVKSFKLPSLEEAFSVAVEGAKPQTKGDPAFMSFIPQADALAVLDTNGNFYLLHKYPKERRCKKDLIFTPLK